MVGKPVAPGEIVSMFGDSVAGCWGSCDDEKSGGGASADGLDSGPSVGESLKMFGDGGAAGDNVGTSCG